MSGSRDLSASQATPTTRDNSSMGGLVTGSMGVGVTGGRCPSPGMQPILPHLSNPPHMPPTSLPLQVSLFNL